MVKARSRKNVKPKKVAKVKKAARRKPPTRGRHKSRATAQKKWIVALIALDRGSETFGFAHPNDKFGQHAGAEKFDSEGAARSALDRLFKLYPHIITKGTVQLA